MDGVIYLLHFERPISDAHTCQHYTGWALDLHTRIADHRAGRGARLTQVAVERGIRFEVVRTWIGSRDFERALKNRKDAPRLCPVCNLVHQRGAQRPNAVQLELPLICVPVAAEDFPTAAPRPIDWYEISQLERWRGSSLAAAPSGHLDDDLL